MIGTEGVVGGKNNVWNTSRLLTIRQGGGDDTMWHEAGHPLAWGCALVWMLPRFKIDSIYFRDVSWVPHERLYPG
jgi:hypothetical protein